MHGIKPSQKEKECVGELVSLLCNTLDGASESGESLLSVLNQNFLSIDESTLAKIRKRSSELAATIWKLNCKLYEMQEFPERKISCDLQSEQQEWSEF